MELQDKVAELEEVKCDGLQLRAVFLASTHNPKIHKIIFLAEV